jgi:NADPH-dependent curcumin reductase CurA
MRILNVPFYGLGVAEVVASGTDKYPVGTLITANTGYEKYTVFEHADNPYNFIRVLPAHARDESTGVGLYNYVSALGMPGLTALAVSFFGLISLTGFFMKIQSFDNNGKQP